MEPPCLRFVVLPSDLLTRICGFVDSADLLALSHVNRHCFHNVLGPNSDVWRSRLPPRAFADNSKWNDAVRALISPPRTLSWRSPFDWIKAALTSDPEPSYKQLYFASRSIRFRAPRRLNKRYPLVPNARRIPETIASAWTASSFSLDVWFVVLNGSVSRRTRGGGILLSATIADNLRETIAGESRAHSFIEVRDGNLYCSMVENRPIVAQSLSDNRWYHLALSFDRHGEEAGTQCVYLDGTMVHTTVGSMHPAWSSLPTKRIGHGFQTDDGVITYWSEFCGVLDDFRLWNGVLGPDNVQQILRGHETETSDLNCVWSLKRDCVFDYQCGMVTVVQCRRPLEGHAYVEEEDLLDKWRRGQLRSKKF